LYAVPYNTALGALLEKEPFSDESGSFFMLFFLLWMQGRKGRMGKNVFWWEVEENFFFSFIG
jgi:hypothetical protein